eukprot:CAMPEP_0179049410 /NCGR_PEP_ID=MMETSP0796-20121207/20198_1 /TAXON_ID=73915 /ORGANISM="Pyrodinium bahamense, Strain pbaha01" /LENGTH=296 /DNA_ID=CAMNT_0020745885 /DNA_START=114 /DNA_END=1004 /DNA_ORIENTATION=+
MKAAPRRQRRCDPLDRIRDCTGNGLKTVVEDTPTQRQQDNPRARQTPCCRELQRPEVLGGDQQAADRLLELLLARVTFVHVGLHRRGGGVHEADPVAGLAQTLLENGLQATSGHPMHAQAAQAMQHGAKRLEDLPLQRLGAIGQREVAICQLREAAFPHQPWEQARKLRQQCVNGADARRPRVPGGVVQQELPRGRVHRQLPARAGSLVSHVLLDLLDKEPVRRVLHTVELRRQHKPCAIVRGVLDLLDDLPFHERHAPQRHGLPSREPRRWQWLLRDLVIQQKPNRVASVIDKFA